MYRTKQKEKVNEYLKNRPETLFSARDLMTDLNLSKTTVYRILDAMIKNGIVARTRNAEKRRDEFRYLGSDCDSHLHLVCSECGEVFCLNCRDERNFVAHLEEKHAFFPDLKETTIYGKCAKCRAKEKKS